MLKQRECSKKTKNEKNERMETLNQKQFGGKEFKVTPRVRNFQKKMVLYDLITYSRNRLYRYYTPICNISYIIYDICLSQVMVNILEYIDMSIFPEMTFFTLDERP